MDPKFRAWLEGKGYVVGTMTAEEIDGLRTVENAGLPASTASRSVIHGAQARSLDAVQIRAETGAFFPMEATLSGEVREDGSMVINVSDPTPRQAVFAMELPEELRVDLRAKEVKDLPDELEMSFSSEEPVTRWGVAEILSHDKADADFSRFKEVGAILKNHNPNIIVGTPTKIWLDAKDRKGRVRFRFGSTPAALLAKREALVDKSLRGTSVGYIVEQYVYLKDDSVSYKNRIKGPAYVATKWSALEGSLTPIAADPSVGVGRTSDLTRGQNRERGSETMNPEFRSWLIAKGLNPETIEADAGALSRLQAEYDQELSDATAKREADAEAEEQRKLEAAKTGSGDGAGDGDVEKIRVAARKEEKTRVAGIVQLCRTHKVADKERDSMINESVSMSDAQERILKILSRGNGSMGEGLQRGSVDGRQTFARAAIESLDLKSGQMKRADAKHGGAQLAGLGLRELARECLRQANMPIPDDLGSMIGAALRGPEIMQSDIDRVLRGGEIISGTTSDFPYILAATANKSMLEGYGVARTSYQEWCKIGSLSDFKAMNRVKLSEAGDLQKIAEGGKYPQTSFSEDKNAIQVYTYGQKFNLSRQAIINDDMNAFTTIPNRLGRSAKRLPNILAVVALNANGNLNDGIALFANGHYNYSADANYALDTNSHGVDGIKNIKTLLGKQRGMLHAKAAAQSNTLYMGLPLVMILVATEDQAFVAAQVLRSSSNPAQANPAVSNPLENAAKVVTEVMLGDSQITGYSESAYYGVTNPMDAPVMEVAFLNGVQEPFMEETNQTDADGRVLLVRLDCGAAPIDFTGMVKEVGV